MYPVRIALAILFMLILSPSVGAAGRGQALPPKSTAPAAGGAILAVAQAPGQEQAPPRPEARGSAGGDLRGFALVSPDEGWILVGQELFWTTDGGRTWQTITPGNLGSYLIAAVHFLDRQYGWLLLMDDQLDLDPGYALARTDGTGAGWQITPLVLFEAGETASLAADAHLQFIDPDRGWLVVEQATGSNFSLGTLFGTTDGGDTWQRLALPLGEAAHFVTDQAGWTAGGPSGQELFRTGDGGRTWERPALLEAAANPGEIALFHPPAFRDSLVGLLPVVVVTRGDHSHIDLYYTSDGGDSWTLLASPSALPTPAPIGPGTRLPLGALPDRWLLAIPATGALWTIAEGSVPGVAVSGQHPFLVGVTDLDMATAGVGWARRAHGVCSSAAGGGLPDCRLEVELVRTEDGGRTWAPVWAQSPGLPAPGLSARAGRAGGAGTPAVDAEGSVAIRSLGSYTTSMTGQGFDKCEIASFGQLQTWRSTSPYRAVNLYIGGVSRACSNKGLTRSFVAAAGQQGWRFILTWVGLQAACTQYPHRMSLDPATAYQQGVSEANQAVEAAYALGLTDAKKKGAVLYFDLEAYNTSNTACRAAAKSFISGWTDRLQARGNLAGVYGASCASAISDFATLPHVPEAIWPANWIHGSYNPTVTVWGCRCFSDGLWPADAHARIRQYAGGHNETWGGVTLNIDSNVIDGIVSRLPADQDPVYFPLVPRGIP